MKKLLAALVAIALSSAPALATDCSGTITTGGTAQSISAINANTRIFLIMNNSANVMCFSWNGSAATLAGTNCGAGSYGLSAGSSTAGGGSFTLPPGLHVNSLSVISATTGDRFSCERQ